MKRGGRRPSGGYYANWKMLIRPKGLIFFGFIKSNPSPGLKRFLEIIPVETWLILTTGASHCTAADCFLQIKFGGEEGGSGIDRR